MVKETGLTVGVEAVLEDGVEAVLRMGETEDRREGDLGREAVVG